MDRGVLPDKTTPSGGINQPILTDASGQPIQPGPDHTDVSGIVPVGGGSTKKGDPNVSAGPFGVSLGAELS